MYNVLYCIVYIRVYCLASIIMHSDQCDNENSKTYTGEAIRDREYCEAGAGYTHEFVQKIGSVLYNLFVRTGIAYDA